MAHDRDHDHPTGVPPKGPEPLSSQPCPDRKRREHPTLVPREPVDPKTHPNKRRPPSGSRRIPYRMS